MVKLEKTIVIPIQNTVEEKINIPVTRIVSKTVPATVVELKTLMIEYHTLYSSLPVTVVVSRPHTFIVSSIRSLSTNIVAKPISNNVGEKTRTRIIRRIGVGRSVGGAG